MKSSQNIRAGSNSTNVQGKEITLNHYNGLTYQDVKEIALDVFDNNFYRLSEKATEVARLRAEELTTNYIQKILKKSPMDLEKLESPDLQYVLFEAQKGYARLGSKELSDLLVDLLVERTTLSDESLMQVVLNESISVASKLTTVQLDILSLVFLLQHSKKFNIVDFESLKDFVEQHILPFTQNLSKNETNYQHLVYAGCGVLDSSMREIPDIFRVNYPSVFSKGFDKEKFNHIVLEEEKAKELFIPCLHNENLYQVGAEDYETVKEFCEECDISEKTAEKIIQLQKENLFTIQEASEFLYTLVPELKSTMEIWKDSKIQLLNLTSVGIALAYSNIKRKIDTDIKLSKWIN